MFPHVSFQFLAHYNFYLKNYETKTSQNRLRFTFAQCCPCNLSPTHHSSPAHLHFTKEDVKYISPAVFVMYVPRLQGQHINQMPSFRSVNPEKKHKKLDSRKEPQRKQVDSVERQQSNSKIYHLFSADTFSQCLRPMTSDKDDY